MAEPKTEQEPSIEEILDSIRQIISDEDAPAAPAAGAAAPASAAGKPPSGAAPAQKAAAAAAPPVVADMPAGRRPEGAAAPAADILDLTEKINAGSEIDLIDKKPTTMEKPMTEKSDGLMSPQTANAATEALSKLLAGSLAVEKDETARNGKVTLEDMTLDLMKPLLKAWLDQNLPGLIEKIVQKEVEKLSRRALDR